MKVAAITLTYNDDFKFNEWVSHFSDYENEIALHIVIDNNSNDEYVKKLDETFTNSHIIKRTSNGGCTGAYNDGIKYALSVPEIDAIMLVGNDIKLDTGATTSLYKILMSDTELGMLSPILLFKDSQTVEDFGCVITSSLRMKENQVGEALSKIKDKLHYCAAVTGGMNIATREFYEEVGLQDNNLFMYSDEVDMGLRAAKSGYKLAATSEAVSWHQHINKPGVHKRESFTKYLMGRNKVYVAKKHFGFLKITYIFSYYFGGAFIKMFANLLKLNFAGVKDYSWVMLGSFMGLIGNMKQNRFSLPSEDVK